ncbi:MAG: hypothetical protein IJS49_05335 [Paludibacteraceae bacterium]|nr:hypothetical protein [Paludibacteraceae bacterium]
MKKLTSLFLALMLGNALFTNAITVHTIGDSTMADYDESTTDKRGWCTYLGAFFDPAFVTVNNRGKSGASTRTFYEGAAYWASVKSQMQTGDYVLIQFAHNDENNNGLDVLEYNAYLTEHGQPTLTDLRGTCPNTTYKAFLRLYVDETRALGCNPVLVAPICRKYFNGNTIRRNGQHDLGDKFSKLENGTLLENQSVAASDHSMDYVFAMREVATEKNVPFIDLTTATRDLYLQYGEQQCTELLFCQGDNTHTATLGANLIARLGAQLLQNAGILAEHISIPTSITATPAALNLGELYTGVQVSKELLLTGFGLSPETGNVSVTATTNLMISTDNETFASTTQASYAGSTLFQRIYIHALYSEEGEQHDTLVITSGNTLIEVPVTASVLSLDGGSPVSVSWALDAKPVADPVIEGPVSATLTLSNMIAADTKNDFTDGSTMVRFHNAVDGAKANWPAGEIDENATRYIDFAITAPTTMELRITGISMVLASHSTSTMCCHINTGFGEEFTDVQTIYERKNFTNKTPVAVILTPVLSVPAGQTLHVRILPWHEDAAEKSGKYICVKNLLIEGQCFSETGLNNTQQDFTSRKILQNGQLLILLPDGTRFDATGRKVE